jgi:hypothetical protein
MLTIAEAESFSGRKRSRSASNKKKRKRSTSKKSRGYKTSEHDVTDFEQEPDLRSPLEIYESRGRSSVLDSRRNSKNDNVLKRR